MIGRKPPRRGNYDDDRNKELARIATALEMIVVRLAALEKSATANEEQ